MLPDRRVGRSRLNGLVPRVRDAGLARRFPPMSFPILGLHHVTATVADAQSDVDFGVRTLGLRLVKRTVNFDNHGVYHFYYGDEVGRPGTLWTTFPYAGRGVPPGTIGAGQVTTTSFSVPAAALERWIRRLRESGAQVHEPSSRFGEESVIVTDPSGLSMELVGTKSDARAPWTSSAADEASAVRGLHSVTLSVREPTLTIAFLKEWLGFEPVNEMEQRTRVGVQAANPGQLLDIVTAAERGGRNGIGTVHHVAFAMESGDDQLRLREDLIRRGIAVTPVMDRQYFRSIYFREPGGVLLEVATVRPGFATDEPVETLGAALKLPPWEEPNRAEIESQLPKITVR